MSLSNAAIILAIAIVGIINALPVVGLFKPAQMSILYGLSIDSPELGLLLQHRALLFGIIGGFVLASLALPQFRFVALLLASISMLGFLALATIIGGYGDAIHRIIVADVIGIIAALVALFLMR